MTAPQSNRASPPRTSLHRLLGRLANRCIPPAAHGSENELLRSKILVAASTSLVVMATIIYFAVPFVMPLSETGGPVAKGTIFAVTSGALASLAILRLSGSRWLASNALALTLWLALTGAASQLGGIGSPTLPLLALLPVVSGLTGGRVAGVGWALVSIATWGALLALDNGGYVFRNAIVPENAHSSIVINLTMMCLFVAAVIFLYETINRNLRESLAFERAELDHQARHDILTQLPNRRMLREQLELGMQRASRAEVSLGLLIVDLDNFKPVNDRYGHRAGDLLLQEVSRRLRERVRATDCVARIGGDEFAVVFEHVKRLEDVEHVARELIEAIAEPVEILGQTLCVRASIGAALYPDHTLEPEMLQEIADSAMYRAKTTPGGYVMADGTSDLSRTRRA